MMPWLQIFGLRTKPVTDLQDVLQDFINLINVDVDVGFTGKEEWWPECVRVIEEETE